MKNSCRSFFLFELIFIELYRALWGSIPVCHAQDERPEQGYRAAHLRAEWLQSCLTPGDSTRNQSHTFMWTPPLDCLPILVTTAHQVAFPVLHRRFSLVAYFTLGGSGAYVSIPSSQFLPQPLLPWYPLSMYFFWWPTFACSPKGKGVLGNKAPAQLNKHSTTPQDPKVKKSSSHKALA